MTEFHTSSGSNFDRLKHCLISINGGAKAFLKIRHPNLNMSLKPVVSRINDAFCTIQTHSLSPTLYL